MPQALRLPVDLILFGVKKRNELRVYRIEPEPSVIMTSERSSFTTADLVEERSLTLNSDYQRFNDLNSMHGYTFCYIICYSLG
jgi:hypothetical protein